MTFPTTAVLDNFNRANEGPPPSADWSAFDVSWGYDGGLVVAGSVARMESDVVCGDFYSAATYGPDCEVYATIAEKSAISDPAGSTFGLYLRLVGGDADFSSASYYKLSIGSNSVDGDFYAVIRCTGGTVSTIDNGTTTIATGDSFGLERSGNTLNVYRKPAAGSWGLIDSVVDGSPLSAVAGNVGIDGSCLADLLPTLDDFGGGDTVTAPAAPTLLTATAVSDTQINLAWTDNATDETGIEVERGIDGVNFALIHTTAADVEAYNNTGLSAATLYYYRVRAVNVGGASSYSNTASATTYNGPLSPPEAPSVLTATPVSIDQINLAWVDNSLYETGFEIERSLTGSSAWSLIYTTAAEAETYSDTPVDQGVTYYYRVRAINAAGNSAYSNTASARIGEFMVTEIANQVITYLAADADLDAVLLFIRGGTPFVVPQDQTPYCEVIIGEEQPIEELTGCVSTRNYRGIITFSVQVTQQAAADWLTPISSNSRVSYVSSYDLVKRLVMVAQTELQRYPSLGELTTTVVLSDQTISEVVTAFRFDGSIIYGLDARADNYENFGSLSFVVETNRTIS